MNNRNKNFLINFSPLLIAAVIMITMIICSYLNDREEIVGYTDHGIPVHMKEINE
tara:strand:+ start:296 stop:460 length:165 start_codon:yes stop_codon:yes gene_type:complete